jgi:hypothetical protein
MRDVLYYLQLSLEAAVGIFGIRSYEEPRYAVVAAVGAVEIRHYAPRLAVEVELAGADGVPRDDAFRVLFRYIAGANAGAEKIAMTTPVAVAPRGEKVAMTVPVATQTDGSRLRMQFFLPARFTADTAPRPIDPRVRLVPIQEQTLAVLRFSGRGTEAALAERKAELLRGLAGSGWSAQGEPSALFYDAPFTLPFLRRNEVAVPVVPRVPEPAR